MTVQKLFWTSSLVPFGGGKWDSQVLMGSGIPVGIDSTGWCSGMYENVRYTATARAVRPRRLTDQYNAGPWPAVTILSSRVFEFGRERL
jgi:hypothetical protein